MLYLILFSVIVIYVLVSWVNVMLEMRRSKVPGPFPLPIVGHGHLLLVDSAGK
jgi:hypothetical protein